MDIIYVDFHVDLLMNVILRLRKRLDEYSAGGEPIGLLFPPPSLCTGSPFG